MRSCLLLISLALVCAIGCGSPRKPVGGQVSYASGTVLSVTFRPTGETKGPACTAEVTGGRYQFTAKDGPFAGTYEAVIKTAETTSTGFVEARAAPEATSKNKFTQTAPPTPPSRGAKAPSPPTPPSPVLVTVPASAPFELDINVP